MTSFSDIATDPTVRLKLFNIEYTDEPGYPITHLFCREGDGTFHHLKVVGHEPSFYIHSDEYSDRIDNHHAVERTEAGYTSVHGEDLVRVYTNVPNSVGEMRDVFETTWEADVLYPNRFLIDTDIYTGLEVSRDDLEGDEWIHVDDIEPCEPPDVDPRMVVVDIEVAGEDGFPDAAAAAYPVSTIVAYDTYNDEYAGWLLAHDSHDLDAFHDHDWEFDTLSICPDESDMLNQFNQWVEERRPDLLSSWYGNGFDYPYLINRCRELGMWSFNDWSPLGDAWDGRYGPVVRGVTMFDMLDGFKKTERHELDSKALDDVAEDVVGETKVDIETDHTQMWKDDPITFLEYNKQDVSLVLDIEEARGIIELYENMRTLTGAQFDDCHAPIDMLDVQFLRKAKERGIVLPTATKPERSWFRGAAVLDPKSGLHENVVYFDLASLYPMLIKLLNVSPEKIVGFKPEWEDDPPDDVRWSYVDDRAENVKKESDPSTERFYYEADEPGFITGFVDDNVKLKEPYRGSSMYIAVKMVVNAIWGILGDGDSYGKGFRLFDWKMGESITLAGRRVLQFTADMAVEKLHEAGYEEAYAVVGDTDGVGVSIPSADREEAVEVAEAIAEEINDEYPDFVKDEFGADENFMEVEMESYASRLLVPIGADSGKAKKRYAQLIEYEDGEWEDDPETEIKGLEYVRSDTAAITGIAQKKLLDLVLEAEDIGTAKAAFAEWLTETVTDIKDGVYDAQKIGRPKGVGQPLEQYGTPDRSPSSTYRGAKYANEFIYEANAIQEGDKPMLFYVHRVGGDLPKTYSAETAEDGRPVDAVTVLKAADLPREIHIDYETMIDKTLREPLNRLLKPMGETFDDMLRSDEQVGLTDFM